MADIKVHAPDGAIEIEVNIATAKSGNEALADARAKAAAQAKAEGRKIAGYYGTRRDGDILTIIFPYALDLTRRETE